MSPANSSSEENMKKLSFMKRQSTLKKKSAELSILCGVSVCMICLGQYQTVETWPENKWDVIDLMSKYKSCIEKGKQKGKRWCDTPKNKRRKLNGNSNKGWDERLNSFSYDELLALLSNLNSNLLEIREKIRALQQKNNEVVMNPAPMPINQNQFMQAPGDMVGTQVYSAVNNAMGMVGGTQALNAVGTVNAQAYSGATGSVGLIRECYSYGYHQPNNYV